MPRGRSFIRTIGGHINSALGSVATRLGVSKRVATVISAGVLAAGLGGTGYLFSGMSETELETFYVGDLDECEDYIQEASEELGQGEIQIPEITSGKYRTGYEGSWENTVESLSSWGGLKPVIDFYHNNNGYKDAQGFERVGRYYIVAVRWAAFNANTGDHITFYFDDGTSIETIVGDEKAAVPKFNDPAHFDDPPELDPVDSQGGTLFSNGWGHILKPPDTDCQVLEFWGRPEGSVYDKLRASTGGNFQRVTSATNHGTLPGFTGGVVEGASSSMTATQRDSAKGAIDECKAPTNYDNSTIAMAAASVAYSQKHTYGEGYDGTDLYKEVCTAIFGSDDATASYDYRSCDRLVGMALRWSGADVDGENIGPTDSVLNYYRQHGELYKIVHESVDVNSLADAEALKLEPGDIMCNDKHTFIYVGTEAIEKAYAAMKGNSWPKGGDCGEPETGTCFVHASNGNTVGQPLLGRSACMQTGGGSGYTVIRYIGNYPDKDKYADLGSLSTLGSTNKKGTSCDCVKEEEEPKCGEEVANLAASLALSAVDDGKDYNQILKDAEVYGTGYGQYTYGSEGRIHSHLGAYSQTSDTAFAEPDPRIPKAEAWIEFQRAKRNSLNQEIAPHGSGMDKDGKHNLRGWHVFADCAAMPWDVWQYSYPELFDYASEYFDTISATRAVDGGNPDFHVSVNPSGRLVKPHFTFILCDENKSYDDQCQPGDILCNGAQPHYMLYIGNEIAQKHFPGTTGNFCEAGHTTQALWGVTKHDKPANSYWFIARPTVCNEDTNTDLYEAFNVYGLLPEDGTLSEAQKRVVAHAQPGAHGGGDSRCLGWVDDVLVAAGVGSVTRLPRAGDAYNAWCHSSDRSQLRPGMIIAVSTHTHSGPGMTAGHIGIYIGGGKVAHNIGTVEIWDLEKWINYYGTTVTPRWGWHDNIDLTKLN